MTGIPTPSQPAADQPRPAGTDSPQLDSAELFRNRKEVTIRHGEDLYRLRLTKNGKLILHK
ncbi:hemin uptake protein HemP [Planctomicrobium sp. SH664]|uniref:hemin uptake protein HemP n=1 Tax=Planctomicrobium sp. SH664 TaxID=3448125 RepID=UPI003F5C5A1F